jgi:hypothetical protein
MPWHSPDCCWLDQDADARLPVRIHVEGECCQSWQLAFHRKRGELAFAKRWIRAIITFNNTYITETEIPTLHDRRCFSDTSKERNNSHLCDRVAVRFSLARAGSRMGVGGGWVEK